MKSNKIYLKNSSSETLTKQLEGTGATLKICRKIQGSVIKKDVFPNSLIDVSPKILAKIREEIFLPKLMCVNKITSEKDHFTKYVFESEDSLRFETVRIPLSYDSDNKKYVVCVSSQIGCEMGCSFCATGKMGLIRDLYVWEIVDQVIQVQKDSDYPVTGVVFMGMGEPLMNYDTVIEAAKIFSEPCGMAISGKAISISTCGILPVMKRFYDENHPYRLIWSLSVADSEKRSVLMPVEKVYPAKEIFDFFKTLHNNDTGLITVTWSAISGFTTSEQDVIELAKLSEGLKIKIDLIDINDQSGSFLPPSEEELSKLRDFFRKHIQAPVARRYSGGRDINAACGMLGGKKESENL